jgi:hypothetical protein
MDDVFRARSFALLLTGRQFFAPEPITLTTPNPTLKHYTPLLLGSRYCSDARRAPLIARVL